MGSEKERYGGEPTGFSLSKLAAVSMPGDQLGQPCTQGLESAGQSFTGTWRASEKAAVAAGQLHREHRVLHAAAPIIYARVGREMQRIVANER